MNLLILGALAIAAVIIIAMVLSRRMGRQELRAHSHRRSRSADPWQDPSGYEVAAPDDDTIVRQWATESREPGIATEPPTLVPEQDHDEYDGEFHAAPTLAGQPVQVEWFGHAHRDGGVLPDHFAAEAALAGALTYVLRGAQRNELGLRCEIGHLNDVLRWGSDLCETGYPEWQTGEFAKVDAALAAGNPRGRP